MNESVVQEARGSFKLCSAHERELDGIAREFPPAIETSFQASKFLMAMAEVEAEPSDQLLRCPACAIGNGDEGDAGYALIRAIKYTLPPERVPLDLVLRRIDPVKEKPEEAGPGTALFTWPKDPQAKSVQLTLHLADHRENPLPPLTLEAFFDGTPRTGKHLRFVLTRIHAGVWKLAPSVNVPGMIVAFVTIVE